MAAYWVLFAIVAVWTALALRGAAPLRAYALIYGINAVLALLTETLFSVVLHRYSFGGYPAFFLITLGITPLLGILAVRYSRVRPLLVAVAGGILLGGVVELTLLQLNVFRYERGWSPYLTTVYFVGYFLWTQWLSRVAGAA